MQRDPVDTIGNTTERVIAPNVWEFIHRASDLYGRLKSEEFGQRQQAIILEGKSESPIEDLFWVALELMCECTGQVLNEDGPEPLGIAALSQHSIGPYRVDYCINRIYMGRKDVEWLRACETPIVVELDGHEFHDKDKRQRSYEKARDRYLVSRGYRVLHFTGSDVVRDPFKVVHEVLEQLRATDGPYDPENPVGIE